MEPTLHRLFTCMALQAMLLCSCGLSQKPGFVSIDCGSDAADFYIDDNGIQWVSDTNLINTGTVKQVEADDKVLASMRLFEGNQSKYCYSLNQSTVEAGGFFLVRAAIWPGRTPPYSPKDPDGIFRFKMIVDANEWLDVKVPVNNSWTYDWWTYYDVYTRAQRSSIDVCFARSSPDGDAPFISALELRPLPLTLRTTVLMNNGNNIFVGLGRWDFGKPGVSSFTRYPDDSLDRLWLSVYTKYTNLETTLAIDVTKEVDEPPSSILQNTIVGTPHIGLDYKPNLNLNSQYFTELYFAEIDPQVNASGLRTFSIYANEELLDTTPGDYIDVFDKAGANSAYSYQASRSPNQTGHLSFRIAATDTSSFPSFLAAAEFFEIKKRTDLTSPGAVSAVEDIKVSLNLTSYTGDPCLPSGYEYPWLNCSGNVEIIALLLSNYGTSGKIPGAINSLTTLTSVYLDGNNLRGGIPDLSALVNLETLDLSNNGLNGSIPDFLATLQNLKELYLQNNNLSGAIPAALLQRRQASQLKFEFSGNPNLYESTGEESGPPTSTPLGPDAIESKKSSTGAIVGGAVAGIVLVVVIGIAAYYCCLRTPPVPEDPQQDSLQEMQLPINDSRSPVLKLSVQEFSFQDINNATNNFHFQLGKGGFGPVYKGCLRDNCFVAIKVASNFSHQGSREFLNEVDLLSRVHHKNLVKLLGFCKEKRLVLVYEFMPNGSLYDGLHGPYSQASPLPWHTRLRILVDAAHGFDYLHNGCNPRIIHRDVKSSNILLNDKMEAKISDFGISRDYLMNETKAPSTALMGTVGYMDPEYISLRKLTEKVDIYSFGVLILEVVSGRKPIFEDSSHQKIHIVEWARGFINSGVIDGIVDVSLHGQYNASSVWKVLEVALACVEIPSMKRPKMGEIYLELKEAERIELESGERNAIDQPSLEFTSGSSLSYMYVSAR